MPPRSRSRNSRTGLQPAVPTRATGLGKTHLLQAIGNYVVAFGGGATVRYTTVESFTNNFITALGAHSLDGSSGRTATPTCC